MMTFDECRRLTALPPPSAAGGAKAALDGYEYQLAVSVLAALRLMLTTKSATRITLEPANEEDLESELEPTTPGRVQPSANVADGYKLVVQVKLEDCIVTADALHCTRAFAAAVRERGGDYALAIKANRGRLFTAVTQQFARSGKRSTVEQIDPSAHDRREVRRATIMRNTSLARLYGFPGAAAVGRITSRRRLRGKSADAPVVRYYLLSKYNSAKRLLHITRSHWGIENRLHWVLDVHFAEDRNRSRCDHAPENLAILRRLALNILRTHPDQASLRRKIKRAGWDNAFLMAILSHMR
ncbi:ISAs1 family transposase [Bradyrhizobium sp. RT9a]|uniref:ISAs1 family transposase n=1 Tax=Bradyrhizobium sp. RT9a TaxID=3156384 RepID=UPI00339B11FB